MFCTKCGNSLDLSFTKNDEITGFIVDYIQNNFYIKEGINLNQDSQALDRIFEAAEEAKVELLYEKNNRENINISIPFIAATPEGPKHLDDNLTKGKLNELISSRSSKLCSFCTTKQDNQLTDEVDINSRKGTRNIEKNEAEKNKNYEGSESYRKMMKSYDNSNDKDQLKKERLQYKKAAVDLAKSNRGYGWLVLILLCVLIPPLWPIVVIWFVLKLIGIFIEGFNEK